MPRLTAEFIKGALSFTNPLKQREIELRGFKIPQIENLGATEDLYDVIDLSDNEIARLENLPALSQLDTLLLNNNKINRIAPNLGDTVPNLRTLILTNNKLSELSDIEPLKDIPGLEVLDFAKVKKKEREAAEQLFGSSDGKILEASLVQQQLNTFVPGQAEASSSSATHKLTATERAKIREALLNAKTDEELNRLEEALQKGKMPKELQ